MGSPICCWARSGMDTLLLIAGAFSAVALVGWLYLAVGRGMFWQMQPRLDYDSAMARSGNSWPTVSVIVPARNEAHMLPHTLPP